MDIVNNWIKSIQQGLFPERCLLCGDNADSDGFCRDCLAELPFIRHSCPRCAIPLPASYYCGRCLRHAPPFDHCWALFAYQPPIDSLIRNLKFSGDLVVARALGKLLARYLPMQTRPQAIIPVPLHSSRLRQRGFNQSMELARWISKSWQIPLLGHVCYRQRATCEQSTLSLAERKRNVQGAFQTLPSLRVRHVALVDDVMTTGHTIAELTRVLKCAGVEHITVWVCARAKAVL